MKIVVIGSNGQLGNEFRDLAASYSQYQFFFFDKVELDITDNNAVQEKIAELKPEFVVNCAAYTAVDKAESDEETSLLINAKAVKNLATACMANGAKFFHISTDYVFDGTATMPYKETDAVSPANAYGRTKLQGESEALACNPETIIIRTAWVYSTHGNNFVKTMLRLMSSRPEINVVADQFGTPTYAADLAEAIMTIIRSGNWVPGIYHFTNDGIITWFDFASEIKKLSASNCIINAIPTEQYPTPAKRPKYSVLDKTKIKETFGIRLKDWRQSLKACLSKLPVA